MKFYQEKFFNSTYWILDNIDRLHLSSNETVVLMMIDYLNHFDESVSVDKLSSKINLSKEETDQIIQTLVKKGYLKITNINFNICFDLSPLFESSKDKISDNDIFGMIEQEFGRTLSQKEAISISELTRIYDNDAIQNALREAVINGKKSINYIEKILNNENK